LQCLVGTDNTLQPTYKCNGNVGIVMVDAETMKVGYGQICFGTDMVY